MFLFGPLHIDGQLLHGIVQEQLSFFLIQHLNLCAFDEQPIRIRWIVHDQRYMTVHKFARSTLVEPFTFNTPCVELLLVRLLINDQRGRLHCDKVSAGRRVRCACRGRLRRDKAEVCDIVLLYCLYQQRQRSATTGCQIDHRDTSLGLHHAYQRFLVSV